MIAFEYGSTAKGVYHPHKVGYDERYAACSPGQVVLLEHLKQLYRDQDHAWVDFSGPLNESTRRWATRTYPLSRLVIATRRPSGRLAMRAYKSCRPAMGRVKAWLAKERTSSTAEPQGAPEAEPETVSAGA
jgi:CelD/BcsL family acetyltransferase involved in cellulose biosynthesis